MVNPEESTTQLDMRNGYEIPGRTDVPRREDYQQEQPDTSPTTEQPVTEANPATNNPDVPVSNPETGLPEGVTVNDINQLISNYSSISGEIETAKGNINSCKDNISTYTDIDKSADWISRLEEEYNELNDIKTIIDNFVNCLRKYNNE